MTMETGALTVVVLAFLSLNCFGNVAGTADPKLNLNAKMMDKHWLLVQDGGDGNNGIPSGGQFGNGGTVGKSHIVSGWEAESSKFPYIISLQIVEMPYKRYHICSAILISTNKAVTAAHCLDYWMYYEHYAAVGFNRLSQHGQALVKVVDAVIHPRYGPYDTGYPNDVAVITLEEDVELTERVQIANLSKTGDPDYFNEYCYITGWGMTEDYLSYPDELRYAFLLAITNYECEKFFQVFETPNLLRYSHKCAWYWPFSTCYGDSGGPLICGDQVVGITSWAADCTGCHPIVFAKVAAFYSWIEKQI